MSIGTVAAFCLASKGSKAKPDESDDAAFINSELGEEIVVPALAWDANGNGWKKASRSVGTLTLRP